MKIVKNVFTDRLKVNSNREYLTGAYPAFKDIIDNEIDKMTADTHNLVVKNVSESLLL